MFPERPHFDLPEEYEKLALWIALVAVQLGFSPASYHELLQHWDLPDPGAKHSAAQLQQLAGDDEELARLSHVLAHFRSQCSKMIVAMEILVSRHGGESSLDVLAKLRGVSHLRIDDYAGWQPKFRTPEDFTVHFNQLPVAVRERLVSRFPPGKNNVRPNFLPLIPAAMVGGFLVLVMPLAHLLRLGDVMSGDQAPYNGGELAISAFCTILSLIPLFISIGLAVVEVVRSRRMSVPYSASSEPIKNGVGTFTLSTNPPCITVSEYLLNGPNSYVMGIVKVHQRVASRRRVGKQVRITYREEKETVGWQVGKGLHHMSFPLDKKEAAKELAQQLRRSGAEYGVRASSGEGIGDLDPIYEARQREDWGPDMASEEPLTGPHVTEPGRLRNLRMAVIGGALVLSPVVGLVFTGLLGLLNYIAT